MEFDPHKAVTVILMLKQFLISVQFDMFLINKTNRQKVVRINIPE